MANNRFLKNGSVKLVSTILSLFGTMALSSVAFGQTYTGVSAAMWTEIEAQRSSFGDPNNCRAKVNAIPTTGTTLTPSSGNAINNALSSSSTVILRGGTYKISSTIKLGSKKLIGAPGETVIIDASSVMQAVHTGSNGTLANVRIMNAGDIGINFLGSSNLLYRVTVGRTGYDSRLNSGGAAIAVWYGAANNCIVSAEAFDSYNETGQTSVTANGGNADGVRNSYTASNNTFIDVHSYRNSDDGWDFWEGGKTFIYFSSAFDNGKTPGKPSADGNGFKLGRGSVRHNIYKSKAYNNLADGFDINGNTVQPLLVQCNSYGNRVNYAGITNPSGSTPAPAPAPTPAPAALPTPVVSLSVQGAPNLPFNGTSTLVTVGFVSGTPTKVELSRDGLPVFATYPSTSKVFFSLSADGKSLTGNWCISSSCWGNVSGPHVLNVRATYADGRTAAASVNLNVADSPPPAVSLAVQGAPNLPFNGTTTQVTVGFVSGTPTKVELSRDGLPVFATYPSSSKVFFTLSADGKSLTGNWCISSSCWGNVSGPHVLNVRATYSDGKTASASVNLNVVASPAPAPAPTRAPASIPNLSTVAAPTMDKFELVASDGGGGYTWNSWGAHQPRITHHADGSIRALYHTLDAGGSDAWALMKKQGDSGSWRREAGGAKFDDAFLLRDAVTDKAHVIASPNSVRSVYSSPAFDKVTIPGSWHFSPSGSRQYSGAGIGADGTMCFKNSHEFGSTKDSDTEYICGKMNASGVWSWNSKISHDIGVRHAYDIIFPGGQNGFSSFVSTSQRDFYGPDLGISSGYVFNAVRFYKTGYASDANWFQVDIVPPGGDLLKRQMDAYIDSQQRVITNYSTSSGLFVMVSDMNGRVLLNKKWNLPTYGMIRMFEDSNNKLWLIWSNEGSTKTQMVLYPVSVTSSPLNFNISTSTDFSPRVSPYRIKGRGLYIAVPRGGNQKTNYIEGLMYACGSTYPSSCSGRDKVLYFRIRLPGS